MKQLDGKTKGLMLLSLLLGVLIIWLLRPFLLPILTPAPAPQILTPGETLRLDLDETAVDAYEDNPLWVLTLIIEDSRTEQPVPADVQLQYVGTNGHITSHGTICRGLSQCQFAIPGHIGSGHFRIDVTAANYLPWQLEFDGNTHRTRSMKIPVQLILTGSEL